ncbi:MAG: hypothetical protein KGN79_10170 [Acidobacteriota bacterium]|nr:hypothetical protein [Acidobacteriota bacterium]
MQNANEWPDELDALIAAPAHHKLLMENEHVRVLETCIPAGEITPVHTHRWPCSAYLISWSDFIRRDADGAVLADSRNGNGVAEGSAFWSPPFPPHTVENVGSKELRVISVEIKTE